MQFILYKDNASERNVSLLANCRVQLILYKDNASERNVSLLANCRVQLILYKDNAEYFLQSYLKTTGNTTFLLKIHH